MVRERFGGDGVPGRSDEELVLALREGDPDAFGLLVFRWQDTKRPRGSLSHFQEMPAGSRP